MNVSNRSSYVTNPNNAMPTHAGVQSDSSFSQVNASSSQVQSVTGTSSSILMQVARVSVHGKCGSSDALILFDTGSDKSYVSKHLVN